MFTFQANNGPVTRLDFFIQGPEAGVAFFVDNVEIVALPTDWKAETDRYVRQIQGFLDQLAQFGLPVWVTELDVLQADETIRADVLEMVLRSVYAHPAVEGVLLWGFWAGAHWREAISSSCPGSLLVMAPFPDSVG